MSMTVEKIMLLSANFHGESTLPALYDMSQVQALTRSELDEDDGLFVGYGFIPSVFPYRMQDLYDRGDKPTPYLGVTLENKYLRALFLPELGGRLWSLYDKVAGRELLYRNSIVRPCNLAVRNAWLAGGIEFNCGMVGHHPFTCSPLFAARTQLDDGTPVLRMYEFERIRRCVYQMDFFLPEDSPLLFARMRIVNPNRETVPMYWWTNMAVPEDPAARNVIDAVETYNNCGGVVGKNPVPYAFGVDITYPTRTPKARDYFWKIPESARKFTAHLDASGYGFVQTSTSRLLGRKLFIWGQGEGGKRWKEFLTADGEEGAYVEIQAGLAHTQYECLPMPPLTAWEWLEGYGAMTADPARVHGAWDGARAEVRERLNTLITAEKMEEILTATKPMAKRAAEKPFLCGGGWGKLENERRARAGEPAVCPHLDFGETGPEQAPWLQLMERGTLRTEDRVTPPASWMLQEEWTALIRASEDCYEKYLHLAAIALATRRMRDAAEAIEKALSYGDTPIALFLKAQTERLRGDMPGAVSDILRAVRLLPGDVSLARQGFKLAIDAKMPELLPPLYETLSPQVQADGRVTMFVAFALLQMGDVDGAERLLWRDGGLSVTDIQEGEVTITKLYIGIEQAKAQRAGRTLDPDTLVIPRRFDYRMG